MSTELKSSRYAVGSDAYFKNINSKVFIGRFMKSSYDYKDATSMICNNISSALDEIYTDLSKYAKTLRYIDSSDLKDMSTFISDLGYIYSKYGSFGGKSSDCISLLNLNPFSTSKNSRASDRDIDTAISFMTNNKYLSTSNSVDLINKVLSIGYRSVSTTDTNCNFLLNILGNYDDENFLNDVMLKYNYTQKPSSYTGKNGKQICSKDYMKAIEKEIFGDNLGISMFSVSSSAYINLISKSFDEIASRIESDLNTGERQNDYLTKENAQNLRECLKALEKVDVRCYGLYSKVDKLDWFIGGKYDSVLELQKMLNKLNPMNRLLEDGVYGSKTSSSLQSFAATSVNVMTYVDNLAFDFKQLNNSGQPTKVTNLLSTKVGSKTISVSTNLGKIANKLTIVLAVYEAYEAISDDINDDIPGFSKETVKEVISGLAGAGANFMVSTAVTGAIAGSTGGVGAVVGVTAGVAVGNGAEFLVKQSIEYAIEQLYDLLDI